MKSRRHPSRLIIREKGNQAYRHILYVYWAMFMVRGIHKYTFPTCFVFMVCADVSVVFSFSGAIFWIVTNSGLHVLRFCSAVTVISVDCETLCNGL